MPSQSHLTYRNPNPLVQFDVGDKQHGIVLTDWYFKLDQSGELKKTFESKSESIATFMQTFQEPVHLFFSMDENGLWFAFWFFPFLRGSMVSTWVRSDRRRNESTMQLYVQSFNQLFTVNPFVSAVIKNTDILKIVKSLGFRIAGPIDGMFGDNPGWFAYMNKNDFQYLRK